MSLRSRLPTIAAVSLAWFAAWALAVSGSYRALTIDYRVGASLDSLPSGWHRAAHRIVGLDRPGWLVGLVVALVAVHLVYGTVRAAVAAVTALGVDAGLVTWVFKPLVDRHEGFTSGYAFPSGHTGAITTVVTMLVLLASRRRVWLAITVVVGAAAIGAMGAALIITDAHVFSDVIATVPFAVTVTLAVGTAVDAIADRVERRRLPPRSDGPPVGHDVDGRQPAPSRV